MPAPAVAVAVSNGGGTSHGLHLVLTVLSCGLWLPIWVIAAIFSGGSSSAVAVAGSGGIVRTTNRRPLVAGVVMGGFVLLGVVGQHSWLLIVFAVLGLLAGGGFWALKAAQQREGQQRHEQLRPAVSARAVCARACLKCRKLSNHYLRQRCRTITRVPTRALGVR